MFGPPLEMMHCGGTAVVWDVTGHEDYVVHGENALVTPTGDYDSIVAALDRLATDPELTARLASGGLSTAAAWPSWHDSSSGFYRWLRLLARHPQSEIEIARITEVSKRVEAELR